MSTRQHLVDYANAQPEREQYQKNLTAAAWKQIRAIAAEAGVDLPESEQDARMREPQEMARLSEQIGKGRIRELMAPVLDHRMKTAAEQQLLLDAAPALRPLPGAEAVIWRSALNMERAQPHIDFLTSLGLKATTEPTEVGTGKLLLVVAYVDHPLVDRWLIDREAGRSQAVSMT